jgi:hypothetical protein
MILAYMSETWVPWVLVASGNDDFQTLVGFTYHCNFLFSLYYSTVSVVHIANCKQVNVKLEACAWTFAYIRATVYLSVYNSKTFSVLSFWRTEAKSYYSYHMAFFAMPQSTAIKIVKPTVSEVDSSGKQRLRKGNPGLLFSQTT